MGKEKREQRDQFKGFLTEYLKRENKELFDQSKDEIARISDQFLNIFDHVLSPERDPHIPGEYTSLQGLEIHHPMRIFCVGLPFGDWTRGNFKDFCAGAEFLTPEFISRREKVMGSNLYTIAKDNPRSLTFSYNGALHLSKT